DAGCDVSQIDAIFITHEHSDHTSALASLLSRRDIPVHITAPSAENIKDPGAARERFVVHPVSYTERIGSFTVTSFPLPHDSAAHVGYIIEDDGGDRLGIATDMGRVTDEAVEHLSGCRRVMLEANHDVEMLKEGPYPSFLKQRVLSKRGHLSNADCAELACTLASNGCEVIALAHLSPENNVPTLAHAEVRRALDSSGHGGVRVVVADRTFAVHLPDGAEV
ncbi:MAG: MBL fold metallo-hydrolase, partial [Clostridia bacterium]|nr:MBL fold metallo-hydrolase [Clostridia bacterium]